MKNALDYAESAEFDDVVDMLWLAIGLWAGAVGLYAVLSGVEHATAGAARKASTAASSSRVCVMRCHELCAFTPFIAKGV